jgi:GntR family transcriptional regulator/MocR family aminotransferase
MAVPSAYAIQLKLPVLENITGMMSAAVMVGEIKAIACASNSEKLRQLERSVFSIGDLQGSPKTAQKSVKASFHQSMLRSYWTTRTIQLIKFRWASVLRPWHFSIEIRRESRTAPYLQIALAIIEEIRRGRLAPGSALPGTRDLAKVLQVNRKTVVLAYEELIAQGWLVAERTRGTFVSPTLPTAKPASFAYRPTPNGGMPTSPDYRLPGLTINIPVLLPEAGMLVFDDGAPDTRLVPVDQLARAYRRALVSCGRGNRLGYRDPRGTSVLRDALSSMLNLDRGLSTTSENVCLTRGSQMAIYLAARILAKPGDTVVVEALSYPPAREAFRATGADVVAVGLDADGMKLDELEKVCRTCRVRCIYVTPHHQFPTTVSLKPDRRLRLLALADQFGFAIVEDDYDHEFHFSHRPMLPLASVDRWGKVVYIGSLSKLLTPSLRVGYLAAPTAFIERAAEEILMIDRQGDSAVELAVADLMESGEIRRHARKVVRVYEERRDIFAKLLRQHFGTAIEFDIPDGGLAFWINFNESIDVEALAATARGYGVKILPGGAYSVIGDAVAGGRLGFASLDPDELEEAVKRLKRAAGL